MRRSTAVACLLVPIAALAACGGGDDVVTIEATPAGLRAASQATLDAETASIEFSITLDPASLGLPVDTDALELTGEGVIDFAGQQSEMRFDLAAIVESLGGGGDQIPEGMFDEPMRVVQDGTTSYVCATFFTMVAGTECLTTDVGDEVAGAGSLFGGNPGIDAESLLEGLGGTDSVEELDREDVLGQRMRHFQGTFTLAGAVEGLSDEDAADLQAAFDRVGITEEFADTPQPFDVWVDDQGRVRQVRQEIDLSAITGEEGSPIVSEFRYVDFGVSVDIEIPTDAADLSELSGLFGD